MKTLSVSRVRAWIPKRKKDANKSSAGRILILAGSKDMAGAAVLSAMGAVKGGGGLVKLAVVRSRQSFVVRRGPLEMTTQGVSEGRNGGISSAGWKEFQKTVKTFHPSVIALGPGLGQDNSAVKGCQSFLRASAPLVVDADGLNALSKSGSFKFKGPAVLTPHPGEISRLLNRSIPAVQENRAKAVMDAAKKYGAVCLLKGPGTLISDGKTVWKNPSGNPGMASGGMGDVLTGLIAALWGQMEKKSTDTALKAAALGAFIHGRAGDAAAKRIGQMGLAASDVAEAIPAELKKIFHR